MRYTLGEFAWDGRNMGGTRLLMVWAAALVVALVGLTIVKPVELEEMP